MSSMRFWLLLLLQSSLLAEEWSGSLSYRLLAYEIPPPAEEQRTLQEMDGRLAELQQRIEAALRTSDADQLQQRRRLRVDLAAVHEERRQVASVLGGQRQIDVLRIDISKAECSPAAVGQATTATLRSAFSHRNINHAENSIRDAATGDLLDDHLQRPPLRPCLAESVDIYHGHAQRALALPGVAGEVVDGLPNPFRCVSSEELLKQPDFSLLASLPGLPLRVRIDLGAGRWREWQLTECLPR